MNIAKRTHPDMGMRIKKAIGYGMAHPDPKWLQARLWDGEKKGEVAVLMQAAYDKAKAEGGRYMQLGFDTLYPHMTAKQQAKYPGHFHDCVWNPSFPDNDDPFYLLATPMCAGEWLRRDDIIDYTEASLRDEPMRETRQALRGGIYPYLSWMDPATGEELRDFSPISGRDRYQREHGREPIPMPPAAIRVIAEELRFDWKGLRPYACSWWS